MLIWGRVGGRSAYRCLAVLLGAFAGLCGASAAHASGDFGCSASWKLERRSLTGCDNGPVLSPGNDTRANLLLLLFNRHGAPPDPKPSPSDVVADWAGFRARFFGPPPRADGEFAEGEGSRCRSDGEGSRAFETALDQVLGVGADERTQLKAARRGLKPTCMGASGGAAAAAQARAHARSSAGLAFARYLQGADSFYAGRFDEASVSFIALRDAPSPWLRDTAAYMQARVEVNRMQVGAYDQYGAPLGPEHVSKPVAASAEAALRAYLQRKPGGLYVGSAQGLLRRVYWLSGRTDRLAFEYAALVERPPRARPVNDADLAEEIDDKLLAKLQPGDTTDPVLLAVYDLQNMRTSDKPAQKDCCAAAMSLAALEAQRHAFAAAPALFDLLLATHAFYVERDPAKVLRLVPDETHVRDGGPVWFSRQVLRGMALEARVDRNARAFWIELAAGAGQAFEPQTVQLAVALHDERAGAVSRVFEAGSPVVDPTVRRILLANVADAALLRRQATSAAAPVHERETALYVLLYKELTRGRYRDFAQDVRLAPADGPVQPGGGSALSEDVRPALGMFTRGAAGDAYPCPAPAVTARTLGADPRVAASQLCVAEWVRLNDLDGDALDTPPPKDELGGTRSLFAGPVYARLSIYRALIAAPATPPRERAYALFRAVSCYATSGNNHCGGAEASKAERKAWFTRLKADYPQSRWAQELQYWW